MGWRKNFHALYGKVKKVFKSPSDKAFQTRVERKARSLGLPNTSEALFVLAQEKNVGYLREFKSLSVDQQNRINQAIRGPNTSIAIATRHKRAKTKELILRTSFGLIHDPFLPKKVIREAGTMSEKAYPYLYIFENSLRNFIILILENKFDKNWWNIQMSTKKLKEISEKVKSRMKEEQRHSFHGKRGVHPIYYSDFGDLIEILKAHKSIFNGYFSNLEGKLDGFTTKLCEIEPSRNVTAHHNPLSERS